MAAIDVYREEGLIDRAAELEPVFLGALEAMRARHPERITVTRGQGLLAAMEIEASPSEWKALIDGLWARRVYTHPKPATGMLVLSPPLCVSEAELTEGLARIEAAIAAL